MISLTAEYALRAMICLGSRSEMAQTTQRIAELTHVPYSYLSKVLQSLGKSGLIHSQRGLHGGFTLARELSDISVLDVVNAVDPIRRICSCPLGIKAHNPSLCVLHRKVDQAIAMVEESFSGTSLAEVLASAEPNSEPLGCEELAVRSVGT